MARAGYVHGTSPSEQERLALLNHLTNDNFVAFLSPAAGARVLEVGSGLGILAEAVARQHQSSVVGVEIAWSQLARAKAHAHIHVLQGDAHHLPVADAAFDVVYARYVLEHVQEPSAVLAEMHRALRPGGTVAVMENDISLIRFDPPCPTFEVVWEAFGRLQRELGGDSAIGRRLFRLLVEAGFVDVTLSFQPELHWFGAPRFIPWIENIIGNVESGRDALIACGFSSPGAVAAAIAELEALKARSDGSAGFCWNRARGRREAPAL